MNKQRRKALEELHDQYEELKAKAEEIRDEEQDYLDHIPDNLQGGQNATKSEAAISELDDVITDTETILGYLITAQE